MPCVARAHHGGPARARRTHPRPQHSAVERCDVARSSSHVTKSSCCRLTVPLGNFLDQRAGALPQGGVKTCGHFELPAATSALQRLRGTGTT